MHIYIPDFWVGVLVTILVEVAIIIVCAVWAAREKKGDKKWKSVSIAESKVFIAVTRSCACIVRKI